MPLLPIPTTYQESRRGLHLVLFYATSYARQQADGEVWSVPTPGGFGTPPFGGGRVIRIIGNEIVDERNGVEVGRRPITTLDDALAFCMVDFDRARGERNDVEVPERTDEPLAIDPAAARVIAEWFDVGWDVLGRILERAGSPDDTERRLWNEHFDLAIEVGSDEEKRRAAVGFSPGDGGIDEPYAYISPWYKDETSDLLPPTNGWGVALPYSEVVDSSDPDGDIERFLVDGLERLGAL
jgi:hypothetical protein